MCSIEEAFQTFSGEPPARREKRKDRDREKRKMKETFLSGTRLPPPEPTVIEPDRPAHQRLPPAELLGGPPTDFTESSSTSQILNAMDYESYFPHPPPDSNQEGVYELGQDWSKVFQSETAPSWIKERMANRQAEIPLKPSPWMDGAPTLWQSVPSTLQGDPIIKEATEMSSTQLDSMQRKLDSMFDKLQAMDQSRAETNHIEILLFLLGGIFLVFLLDLLVKQGMQATAMIAGSLGGSLPRLGSAW